MEQECTEPRVKEEVLVSQMNATSEMSSSDQLLTQQCLPEECIPHIKFESEGDAAEAHADISLEDPLALPLTVLSSRLGAGGSTRNERNVGFNETSRATSGRNTLRFQPLREPAFVRHRETSPSTRPVPGLANGELLRGHTRTRPGSGCTCSAPTEAEDASQSLKSLIRKMLVHQAKMTKTIEANGRALTALSTEVRSLREAVHNSETSLPPLPVQSQSELEELNSVLKDPRLSAKLTERLRDCLSPTASTRQNVRYVMQGVFGGNLGSQLSLSGRNGKAGISNTRVVAAILKAFRVSGLEPGRSEINRGIAKWLSGSRDRNGGRLRRLQHRDRDRQGPDRPEGTGSEQEEEEIQYVTF